MTQCFSPQFPHRFARTARALPTALLSLAIAMAAGSPAIAQGVPAEPELPPAANSARFSCQFFDGQAVVVYSPESQPDRLYPWAVPSAMGGGWTPDRRCREIARRLEEYRPLGLLDLTTSVENGYDIVCATVEQRPGCQIVFTVPPGQDPLATRDRVFANLSLADTGQPTQGVYTFTARGASPRERRSVVGSILDELGLDLGQDLGLDLDGDRAPWESGTGGWPLEERDGDWRGSSRRDRGWGRSPAALNLRPFLDPADGGTGRYLRN